MDPKIERMIDAFAADFSVRASAEWSPEAQFVVDQMLENDPTLRDDPKRFKRELFRVALENLEALDGANKALSRDEIIMRSALGSMIRRRRKVWRDLGDPRASTLFHSLFRKRPIFHISAKQYKEWGSNASDGITIEPNSRALPPFDEFCIVIDPHADVPEWSETVDLHGTPIQHKVEGVVVIASMGGLPLASEAIVRLDTDFHETLGGLLGPLGQPIHESPDDPTTVGRMWTILEHVSVRADINNLTKQNASTTTALQYDAMSGVGGFLLSADLEDTDDIERMQRLAARQLRRLLTFLYLINDRIWDEFDPMEGRPRIERRPIAVEEKKRGWNGTHYRIFLNRKRKKGYTVEPGTGKSPEFMQHVRRHERRYKSGRVVVIEPFVKGKDKPERPKPSEYDAWGLDGRKN